MSLKEDLSRILSGEIDTAPATLESYSHDASLFEVKPQVVVYPKDSQDVQALVKYAKEHKTKSANSNLSITARSAGTNMSGGAVGDSIVADFTKHFNQIFEVTSESGHAQPGVYYRDFEKATFEHQALMPSYPASRDLCTIGGMVNNNSGGEKSLEFGKTENFVTELKVVLADGNEYDFCPAHQGRARQQNAAIHLRGRGLPPDLRARRPALRRHQKAAKPHVTKNSTGYNLWDVWDRETGIFDLTKLIVGAQGTLGLTTDITLQARPAPPAFRRAGGFPEGH